MVIATSEKNKIASIESTSKNKWYLYRFARDYILTLIT